MGFGDIPRPRPRGARPALFNAAGAVWDLSKLAFDRGDYDAHSALIEAHLVLLDRWKAAEFPDRALAATGSAG